LQYDGRINRSDLITHFDISMPQASADIGLYQSLAHENMAYDSSARVYVAQPGFKARSNRSDASRYLDEIHRLARGVVEADESFVGFVPPTGVVATPARAIGATEVATLVRAIRDKTALRVRYQSMDQPRSLPLVLSPHALGFDGLRWHERAWCHQRKIFRDFAIGRLQVDGQADGADEINPKSDAGWNTQVAIVLEPHPKLSPDQRDTVMRDYDMTSGELILECRKAMLFYTLRHLNLENLKISRNPATQHVVVKNAEDVARWVREDREGK
jgi:predicted DNA-binding transcriptional regulator YafY